MKHLKHILIIIATAIAAVPSLAQNTDDLDRAVSEVRKDPNLRHASLSVCVHNISTGKSVYTFDAQRSLLPASMNKIFTTAIGFDRLGSEFRFKTSIGYKGKIDNNGVLHGNLYITGGGDPLLGSYRYRQTSPDSLFASWHQALTSRGIKSIDGRICFDASIFDNQPIHDSWHWGDIGNYYGTGISGLNFHENMYFVYFNAGKRIGYPATVDHIVPKNLNVRQQNDVITGPEASGDNVIIYGDPKNPMRHYRGSIPLGKRNFPVRGAMPNPAETCAEVFASYLRTHGTNVSSNVTEIFAQHDSIETILDYYSQTYYVIAQYTNQTSNNMYAESIFKYLGYQRFGKGSYANGAKVISEYLKTHGIESSGVSIVDGSGLSRQDKVTTDFVCRFLTEIYRMPNFKDFVRTMAEAGKNGTAKYMLNGLPPNITVKIKSGTMDGIKAFCGYVTTAKGDDLCFSVICNDYECSASQMQKLLEKILFKIALL